MKPKKKVNSSFKPENAASIQPAIAELERLYGALAPRFSGLTEHPSPRIVIQSRGRKRHALGWFARERWRNGQADAPAIHEITVTAESLALPVTEIVGTLVHEMVHLILYYLGIQDVGKDGRYHNRHFKAGAEAVGLIVEKDLRIGWARTSLGPELAEYVSSLNVNDGAFAVFRLAEPEREKQPTKMKKWVCGCKGARSALEINYTCEDCGNVVVMVDRGIPPYPRKREPVAVAIAAAHIAGVQDVLLLMRREPEVTEKQKRDLDIAIAGLDAAREKLGASSEKEQGHAANGHASEGQEYQVER